MIKVILEEFVVYFLQELPLEGFQLVSLDRGGADIVEANEGGLGKHIFKVGQLLLQESILGREASILLIQIFMELL